MTVRPVATFQTTLPDDSIDYDDAILLYPGRTITARIAEKLSERGHKRSRIENRDLSGWAFVIPSRLYQFVVRVIVFEEVLVEIGYRPCFYDRIFGRKDPLYRQIIRDVDAILQSDPTVSGLCWHTQAGDGSPADHPIDDP